MMHSSPFLDCESGVLDMVGVSDDGPGKAVSMHLVVDITEELRNLKKHIERLAYEVSEMRLIVEKEISRR